MSEESESKDDSKTFEQVKGVNDFLNNCGVLFAIGFIITLFVSNDSFPFKVRTVYQLVVLAMVFFIGAVANIEKSLKTPKLEDKLDQYVLAFVHCAAGLFGCGLAAIMRW